eukprot:scaffold5451_cov245-Chaetoceros_neogracile.AAC.2
MEPKSSFASIQKRLNSIAVATSGPSAPSSSVPLKRTEPKKRKILSPLPDISPVGHHTPMKSKHRGRENGAPKQANIKQGRKHESKPTLGARRSSSKTSTAVEFETILRMRPLSQEEEGDEIALTLPKRYPNTVRLHALKEKLSATPRQKNKKSDSQGKPLEYHFDRIIDSENTQDDMYNEMGGLVMAQNALGPLLFATKANGNEESEVKNHVLFSLGVTNSGKTFTLLGCEDGVKENEGMIPRLIDDLFLPERNDSLHSMLVKAASNCSNTTIDPSMVHLELELSMVHIHKDQVFDMLSSYAARRKNKRISNVSKMINTFETTSKGQQSMQELKISLDERSQDFVVRPNVVTCKTSIKAREVMNAGMEQNITAATKFNKHSSRGHTLITLQPVMTFNIDGNKSDTVPGASITIIDMAGIERTGINDMNKLAIRESISINSSISAVLQCLRSIKSQHDSPSSTTGSKAPSKRALKVIPYRENKLTMLMQPLFSGGMHHGLKAKRLITNVKVLLSVYPGARDYNEKEYLLSDLEHLKGLSVKGACLAAQRDQGDIESSLDSMEPMSTDRTHADVKGARSVVIASTMNQRETKRTSIDYKENIGCLKLEQNPISRSPLQHKNPLNRLANAVIGTSLSSKKRKTETHLHDRIRKLEEENEELKKIDKKRKRACITLKDENKDLRKMLEETEEREANAKIAAGENVADTQELLQAREWRHRHQSLLGSPLTRHMKKVEGTKNIFTGRVGSQLTHRSPFKLTALTKHPTTPEKQSESGGLGLGSVSFSA